MRCYNAPDGLCGFLSYPTAGRRRSVVVELEKENASGEGSSELATEIERLTSFERLLDRGSVRVLGKFGHPMTEVRHPRLPYHRAVSSEADTYSDLSALLREFDRRWHPASIQGGEEVVGRVNRRLALRGPRTRAAQRDESREEEALPHQAAFPFGLCAPTTRHVCGCPTGVPNPQELEEKPGSCMVNTA